MSLKGNNNTGALDNFSLNAIMAHVNIRLRTIKGQVETILRDKDEAHARIHREREEKTAANNQEYREQIRALIGSPEDVKDRSAVWNTLSTNLHQVTEKYKAALIKPSPNTIPDESVEKELETALKDFFPFKEIIAPLNEILEYSDRLFDAKKDKIALIKKEAEKKYWIIQNESSDRCSSISEESRKKISELVPNLSAEQKEFEELMKCFPV